MVTYHFWFVSYWHWFVTPTWIKFWLIVTVWSQCQNCIKTATRAPPRGGLVRPSSANLMGNDCTKLGLNWPSWCSDIKIWKRLKKRVLCSGHAPNFAWSLKGMCCSTNPSFMIIGHTNVEICNTSCVCSFHQKFSLAWEEFEKVCFWHFTHLCKKKKRLLAEMGLAYIQFRESVDIRFLNMRQNM